MTDPAHANAVEDWRAARYAALRRERGWLTLVGLGWLRDGENRVGSDPDADVVLPTGPPLAGTVTVAEGGATATGFLHGGREARDLRLLDDAVDEPTLLEVGSLRLCLIERGGRLAIRAWDVDAPARRTFTGIDHWPVDPAWRLNASLERTPGLRLRVPDVLGFVDEQPSPGEVVFTVQGVEHRLQGLTGGDAGELWLVFADLTNGVETYAGGRFLYTEPPDPDGRVMVDFNRAYNPPCVFSPYATCPLPWAANRLPIRVDAGERMYRSPAAPGG
jgi:uncharacterized protein